MDDDGDTEVNEALSAASEAYVCDGDGFTGSIESATGTEPQARCPDPAHGVANAWPLDSYDNGFANVTDVLAYKNKVPAVVDATHPKSRTFNGPGRPWPP